ncbi:MAG: S1 family peptidase [Defluviitaleaceae bacterium]|nr:S1 family peptidase [Defluviitaleaceae bacterium]
MLKKRLTALVLVVIFVLSGMIIYGQSSEENLQMSPSQARLYDGLTFEEFSQTSHYRDTIMHFTEFYGWSREFSENYIRTLSYIDNLSATFADGRGEWNFPDYIDDMYINDDGILVIQLSQSSMETTLSMNQSRSMLSRYVDLGHIIFETVEFSRAELDKIIELLANWVRYNDPHGEFITGFGTAVMLNRVEVDLYEATPESIDYFRRNIIDSPMVIFNQPRVIRGLNIETTELFVSILQAEGMWDLWLDTSNNFTPEAIMHLREIFANALAEESGYVINTDEMVEGGDSQSFLYPSSYPWLQYPPLSSDYGAETLNDRTVRAGERMYNNQGRFVGSAGFRVRHMTTGREGFVTAAHNFPNGQFTPQQILDGSGRVFWGVTTLPPLWQHNADLDAVFVHTQSTVNVTNTLLNGQILSTVWSAPTVGMRVAFQGGQTAVISPSTLGREGVISHINHQHVSNTAPVTVLNTIRTNLVVWPGDSGSPMYQIADGVNRTMGITIGNYRNADGIFMPANRIIQGLQLSRY